MEPADLAGLLAREVEAGVVAALHSVDAADILEVDTIVARVGAGPDDDEDVDWSRVPWQSEYVLRIKRDTARGASSDGQGMALPDIVAALPVRALIGVGAYWEPVLKEAGIDTVGQLAALDSVAARQWIERGGGHMAAVIGRARALPRQWPNAVPSMLAGHSVRHMLEQPPDTDARGEMLAIWEYCMALAAGIDHDVLSQLPIGGF